MTNYKNVGNFDPHLVSTKILAWRAPRRAQNQKCCSKLAVFRPNFHRWKVSSQIFVNIARTHLQ